MIETMILSALVGSVIGAALCNFIIKNKKYRSLKLSDSNITVYIFDKECGPKGDKHYIGVQKGDKIVGAMVLDSEGITDVKFDV